MGTWELIVLSVFTVGQAVFAGYLFNKRLGAFVLGLLGAVACLCCLLGNSLRAGQGLLGMALLIGVVAFLLVHRVLHSRKSAVAVTLLWYGYCLGITFGYCVGGWMGLLAITLPALLAFWGSMYYISPFLLPLCEHDQRIRARPRAFRCLVTFLIGTNYPYQVMENDTPVERVTGNSYQEFFAGPGIVLTGCHHVSVAVNAKSATSRVLAPGLSFTDTFEGLQQVVDLRPQLRTFIVEAFTKDGVKVRLIVFIPFRIAASRPGPMPGGSFPYEDHAVLAAVRCQEIQEHGMRKWDELVPFLAADVIRSILAEYNLQDLYLSESGLGNMRREIGTEMLVQLQKLVVPYGIRIIGGWFSNILLDPVSTNALVENWQEKISDRSASEQSQQRVEWQTEARAELVKACANVYEATSTADDLARSLTALLVQKTRSMQ